MPWSKFNANTGAVIQGPCNQATGEAISVGVGRECCAWLVAQIKLESAHRGLREREDRVARLDCPNPVATRREVNSVAAQEFTLLADHGCPVDDGELRVSGIEGPQSGFTRP